jgi:hypothetical protein
MAMPCPPRPWPPPAKAGALASVVASAARTRIFFMTFLHCFDHAHKRAREKHSRIDVGMQSILETNLKYGAKSRDNTYIYLQGCGAVSVKILIDL